MENLFFENEQQANYLPPLAERMRPKNFEEVLGQNHLLGKDAPLRRFFENSSFPSIIFWGPPGVGKTTLAFLIADVGGYNFIRISAVEAGVKEVKDIIAKAKNALSKGKKTLLFIDEIHRFNKAQQDYLLHAVEKGIVTLIGATTENPSFEVIPALLSRCQVYKLHPLEKKDILEVLRKALINDATLSQYEIQIEDFDIFYTLSGGDARVALNLLEISFALASKENDASVTITKELVTKAAQQKASKYDKHGDYHYDTISAFIKSLRGSDPDAALIWLAKMLEAGEDPLFIARRMVIFASEDIGNADPFALPLAIAVFHSVQAVGMPEAQISLAQGVTYLASTEKSNASYVGLMEALKIVRQTPTLEVPLHLRNAPTRLMKQFGYAAGYKYPHDYPQHFVPENYFPIDFSPKPLYFPTEIGKEKKLRERLFAIWKNRYQNK